MTFSLTRLAVEDGYRDQLARDVRAGLTATPKTLPPKYFYDGVGSKLFEDITRLPEYYQTRTETAILERVATPIVAELQPTALVELGSGASRKTRALLEAMRAAGTGDTYVAFDVSEDAVTDAAEALTATYPWLAVIGIVGDFDHHLDAIPDAGRRLFAFLGSTIGNLDQDGQVAFLSDVAATLDDDEALLCGFDLVKDPAVLQRAYDDAQGVTAAFNRNVLAVINQELDGDFDLDAFTHVARWNAGEQRIEMWLRAERDMVVCIDDLDLQVAFAAGEEMHTEISCKFTRETVERRLASAGLALARWETDPRDWFAVAVARRRVS